MFATSILLPCGAKKSRDFALKTAGFSTYRASKQPSFAKCEPAGRQPREVALTALANGYEN
jgi:hypothetical protein